MKAPRHNATPPEGLAAPDAAPDHTRQPTKAGRTHWARMVTVLVVALAALAVGVWASGLLTQRTGTASPASTAADPRSLGGDTADASWTARPRVLPVAEQSTIGEQCRDVLIPEDPPGSAFAILEEIRAADLVLADTRGEWTSILLSNNAGLDASCLMRGGEVSGSIFGEKSVPPLAADEVVVIDLLDGLVEPYAWRTQGHAGGDVAAVTIVTDDDTRVEATLTNGRFAAWWPDAENVDPLVTAHAIRYELTLTDGSVQGPVSFDDVSVNPAG